jgi:exopolysaccharide biosynthesis polyprenyl glycosylphosphotransferase
MYQKKASGWIKHLDFMVMDLVCLEVSFLWAYMLYHRNIDLYAIPIYRNMAIVLLLLDICVMTFWETFSGVLRRGYYQEFVVTLKQTFVVLTVSVCYLFVIKESGAYSRIIMFLTGGIYFILSYISRIILKKSLESLKLSTNGKRSMIIVTDKLDAENVVEHIKNNNYGQFHIVGIAVVDEDMVGESILDIPVVANADTVVEYTCREWADEAFLNLPSSEPLREKLINQFVEMGLVVHLKLAEVVDFKGRKQHVEKLASYTVLSMGVNMVTVRQMILKRLMDIAGGIVGCIIMAILFIFVAPLIYIKSPGPIFFKQKRVGKNGKQFEMYKFRSMYMDAEERKKELMAQNKIKDGMMFKLDYDPRIIGSEKGPGQGLGNFIRKYSIDEFPQFINVLKGDMSLVGTRPPTLDEWEKYELHHRARLATKPGITGLWQVSGRSSITDFEEVVKLDTDYIINWSFALDLKILLKTVVSVLKKEGAS